MHITSLRSTRLDLHKIKTPVAGPACNQKSVQQEKWAVTPRMKKKVVQGSGKRGLKGGNNEIVNPKERGCQRLGKKKKIVSKTCSDVDVTWLT